MKVIGHLYDGAAILRRYPVNATVSTVGIPLLVGTETENGLDLPTTTAAADVVGINYDKSSRRVQGIYTEADYGTAQQSDNSDPEVSCLVNIRPDALIQCRLSGSTTSGTALTLYDVTTASTDGLTVTTGDDWSSPEFDDGVLWGYDGANKTYVRKITSTGATAATVTVALPFDTAVGDNFLRAPFYPADDQSGTVTLTATFDEVDASVAVATDAAEFEPVWLVPGTIDNDGRARSYVVVVADDHFFNKLS